MKCRRGGPKQSCQLIDVIIAGLECLNCSRLAGHFRDASLDFHPHFAVLLNSRMYGFDAVYGRIFDGYYGIRDGICRTVQ
jgi:hypothetical protein